MIIIAIKSTQISFVSGTNDKFESEFSKKLYKQIGYYANDFNLPAQRMDNIIEIWRDESIFNEYYGISTILYDLKNKDALQKANSELHGLLKEFDIENIHFTEILGGKNILSTNKNKREFMTKFYKIIKPVKFTVAMSVQTKEQVEKLNKIENIEKEDVFHLMFWRNFRFLVETLPDYTIINIFKEIENNFSSQYELESWNRLNVGIKYIQEIHPQKRLSICKYPQEFTKRCIIKSAVSDLVAYVGTKVQSKLLMGIPLKKVKKEYGYILEGFKECFTVTSFLSMDFRRLIDDEYNLMCETFLGDKL